MCLNAQMCCWDEPSCLFPRPTLQHRKLPSTSVCLHPACKIEKLLLEKDLSGVWYNELRWDIPQWRCWGVLTSESRFFSFMFKDSNSVNNHFPAHSYCSVFVFKSPRIFLPEVAGIWVFPSGRVIFFLLTSHSFVKLGKCHKSLGHSSDVQIQTCTSILSLSWVFISTRNGDVGVQKHPNLLWDTAGKEALEMTLKGPDPFECLWHVTQCDVQVSITWLWNGKTCDVL